MKKSRLSNLIDAYRNLDLSEEDLSFFDYLRKVDPWVFSHHSPVDAFRSHVWCWKGLYFCKGCVCTLLGIILGFLIYFTTQWIALLANSQATISFIALLLPSLICSLCNAPRVLKNLSRVLLGILLASALIFLFLPNALFMKLIVVFVYFCVRVPLVRKREIINKKIEKKSCAC